MIQVSHCIAFGTALLSVVLTATAQTQDDLAAAQDRFADKVIQCNNSNLPRPQRDACIRDAGRALDKARGGPPATTTTRLPNRRSTVVVPEGEPAPPGGQTVRSPDRRSTVVVPQGESAPSGGQTVRSPDRRSTVVMPTDQSVPTR